MNDPFEQNDTGIGVQRENPPQQGIKTAVRSLVEDRITVAREAILQELRRRWREDRCGGVTAPADISRFYQPQTNYFCGDGVMRCPICGTGQLQYSRSSYNGHVKARCSTKSCVAWQE